MDTLLLKSGVLSHFDQTGFARNPCLPNAFLTHLMHTSLDLCKQAVIVRDDEEKRKLKDALLEQYGSAAKGLLVLTVHECKGLEFQVGRYNTVKVANSAQLVYLLPWICKTHMLAPSSCCIELHAHALKQKASYTEPFVHAWRHSCNSTNDLRSDIQFIFSAASPVQNVLIHRFFTTSPLGNKWRLMYSYMNEKGMLTDQQKSSAEYNSPKFNPQVWGISTSMTSWIQLGSNPHCHGSRKND